MKPSISIFFLMILLSSCAAGGREARTSREPAMTGPEISVEIMKASLNSNCMGVSSTIIHHGDGTAVSRSGGGEVNWQITVKGGLLCYAASDGKEVCYNVFRTGENRYRFETVTPKSGFKCDMTVHNDIIEPALEATTIEEAPTTYEAPIMEAPPSPRAVETR